MTRLSLLVSVTAALCLNTTLAWAGFVSAGANPNKIKVNVDATLTVTVEVADPRAFVHRSAKLERLRDDGKWKTVSELVLQSQSGNVFVLTNTKPVNEASTGNRSYRVSAAFRKEDRQFSPAFALQVFQVIDPTTGGTVSGNGGTSVTFSGDTILSPVKDLEVSVEVVPNPQLPSTDSLVPVLAVNLRFSTPGSGTTDSVIVGQLERLDSVVPNPVLPGVTLNVGDILFVGHRERVVDQVPADGGLPGLDLGFVMVGTSRVTSVNVNNGTASVEFTTATIFNKAPYNGVYGLFKPIAPGFGFVSGVVQDPGGNARSGVFVSQVDAAGGIYKNLLSFYTGTDGKFRLPVLANTNQANLGPFEVVVRDPLGCIQGTSGARTITLPPQGGEAAMVLTDLGTITLSLASPAPLTRTGLRSGGFEMGVGPCWSTSGTVNLIDSTSATTFRDLFGLGTLVEAHEAERMVAITSSNGFVEQEFKVPGGASELWFDFNFACDASNATCSDGTQLQANAARLSITLEAQLILPPGSTTTGSDITSVTKTFGAFGGQLGWRKDKLQLAGVQVPNPDNGNALEALPGSNVPVRVRFTAQNQVPGIASAVLLDNVRFHTIHLYVNILQGAMSSLPGGLTATGRVEKNVRDANRVLSQAGVNLQVRHNADGSPAINTITHAPASLLDISYQDVNPPAVPSEASSLINLSDPVAGPPMRSPFDPRDVHVYYVRSLRDSQDRIGANGISIEPDTYPPLPVENRAMILGNPYELANLALAGSVISGYSAVNKADFDEELLQHELLHYLIAGVQAETAFSSPPTGFQPNEKGLEHKADVPNAVRGDRCRSRSGDPAEIATTVDPPCNSRSIVDYGPVQGTGFVGQSEHTAIRFSELDTDPGAPAKPACLDC